MHIPVLLDEVLHYINPTPGACIVDATFGMGGHSCPILQKIKNGRLIGFEKDERTFSEIQKKYAHVSNCTIVNTGYENMDTVLEHMGIHVVDGVLFDFGVSSLQLDDPDRGMSFRHDAVLDMRFSQDMPLSKNLKVSRKMRNSSGYSDANFVTGLSRASASLLDAKTVVNNYPEEELIRILREYGEERYARRIARAVCSRRKKQQISNTKELADIITSVVPRSKHIHPATRTFQALRIEVNDELNVLDKGLSKALSLLAPGGRIVAISFHSLEDRRVKSFFKREAQSCICPPDIPVCNCLHEKNLKVLTRTPIRPSSDEVSKNPRSRSALLRAAEKI